MSSRGKTSSTFSLVLVPIDLAGLFAASWSSLLDGYFWKERENTSSRTDLLYLDGTILPS